MSETFVVSVGTPPSTEDSLNPMPLPFTRPLLIENVGEVSAYFSYTQVLPTPFRGHELRPGESGVFPGEGPLYVNADLMVPLIISTL